MKWFRYVAHKDIPTFEAKGWRVHDDLADIHHGSYAVLMIWEGDHAPD